MSNHGVFVCYTIIMSNILAIIPTFNSVDLVIERIVELKNSTFTKIVICDDKSDDGTVSTLKEKYGDLIEVISGDNNLGPGGNRNRILTHELIETADYLFFLDADCQIIYKDDITDIITKSFERSNDGVIGFSLVDRESNPMRWNYGELMHPVHEAPDQKLEAMLATGVITNEQFIEWAPSLAASYRMTMENGIKEVGWVAEGCFAVRADLFKRIGGFADQMRYHEAHDFNARVQELDYKTLFNPIVVAQHLEFDSRMERRDSDNRSGKLYYYQKHWGMSEEVYSKLFDESSTSI